MFRRLGGCVSGSLLPLLGLFGFSLPARAQTLHSVIQPTGRVFPSVRVGVTAIKRDSLGRYYILAKPANRISIYLPDGRLVGEIPPASAPSPVSYAMDFDIGPDGNVYVADRGGNAVFVFRSDGSLVSRVPVFAPTSVVALSGRQFAVASFHARRLVQVFNERGEEVRSFGDPVDSGAPAPAPDDSSAPKEQPMYLGRIFDGPSGQICFAFSSTPDPTFRTYDRYGYVAYEASIPESELLSSPSERFDRFEFSFNFTRFDLSDQISSSATVGSSGDVRFGGGVGMGLGARLNPEPGAGAGFGGRGGGGGALGGAFGGGPPGAGGSSGMLSAQASLSKDSFHVTLGNPSSGSSNTGGGGGSSSAANSSTNLQGGILQFASSGTSYTSGDSSGGNVDFAQLESTDILNSSGSSSNSGIDSTSDANNPSIPGDLTFGEGPGAPGGVFAEHFLYGRFFGGGGFGFGGPGGLGGPRPDAHSSSSSGSAAPADFAHFGPRGHFGQGMIGMSGGVRINLDKPVSDPTEKPVLTALAVDPNSHNVWAVIGDSLVEFDKSGNPLGVFSLVSSGNVPLKPTAILVEPDRLLVAADPFGIFLFARPDAYLNTAARAQPASSRP